VAQHLGTPQDYKLTQLPQCLLGSAPMQATRLYDYKITKISAESLSRCFSFSFCAKWLSTYACHKITG
jgi:hypothetical protein